MLRHTHCSAGPRALASPTHHAQLPRARLQGRSKPRRARHSLQANSESVDQVGVIVDAIPAREQLTVFVPGGGDLPGLTFYGLSPLESTDALVFPSDSWPHALTARPLRLYGNGWQVRGWDLPILAWPASGAFREAVRSTLASLIRSGACVAWVGAEGVPFCDPPALLDPGCMSGGVLAWLTEPGWFGCPLDPDRPWASASDEVMADLRRFASELATIDD